MKARAPRIEIGKILLAALIDQLAMALQRAPGNSPLDWKGTGW
jgi:hypothetical protein